MFPWSRTQATRSGSGPLAPQPKPVERVAPEPAPEPAPPEPEGPSPARRLTDAPCATRLGGLRIRGTLTGSDSVELSGTFDGPITVEGLCRVGAGGHVTGDVTAGDAVIAGDVQGRLTVIGRLELGAHARVVADIEAGTIAIAEGCFIEGRIHMRGSEGGSQPVTFKEKRRGKRRKGQGPKATPTPAAASAPVAAHSTDETAASPPVAETSAPPAVAAPAGPSPAPEVPSAAGEPNGPGQEPSQT